MQKYPIGNSIVGEENQKSFIRLFSNILKLKNILSSFDEFEGNEIISLLDFQDYQSMYIDLYQNLRPKDKADRENINDDIVFEMELIKQIEVNIDYILMLLAKYYETNCQDKTILVTIEKAINSSIELRSKKELIEGFIQRVNLIKFEDDTWSKYIVEQKEKDLNDLIVTENLKPEETQRFVNNSLRDGALKTIGADIDKILPPVSRFSGNRAMKKQTVIEKLLLYFEKYFGIN
jgi:type I restriction enzyme R subunit